MNVLLIYPPDRIEQKATCPPLGLAYIASVLLEKGHNVSILEINAHRYSENQVRRILRNYAPSPDIIGVGGIVSTYRYIKWLTKEIKEIYPSIPLLIGGSVGSSIPHLIFKHTPVDVIVDREGEMTVLEIVNELEKGNRDLSGVAGIFYRRGGGVVCSSFRKPITDLDSLPFPAYQLLPMEIYIENVSQDLFYKEVMGVSSENRLMPLVASRGCTGRCSFCFRQFPRIAMNSADYMYKHILHLHSQYGVNRCTFMDELFIVSKQRTIELINVLNKLNKSIDLRYRISSARVDSVDLELLKKLKASGCVDIVYGIESGSQKMLYLMNKRTTVEQNRQAVLLTHEAGLHTTPQFVVGLPGETEETLKETIEFARQIDFWDNVGFHFANPYPGTDIYTQAKEKSLFKDEDEFVAGLAGTDNYPLQLGEISFAKMEKMLRFFVIKRVVKKNIVKYGYFYGTWKLIIYFLKKITRNL